MGSEIKARYTICGIDYFVYGCWSEDTPECKYDLYDKDGTCLNEGEPFDELPTYDEVKEYVNEFVKN